jgi:hypothetical protein
MPYIERGDELKTMVLAYRMSFQLYKLLYLPGKFTIMEHGTESSSSF